MTTGRSDPGSASLEVSSSQAALGHSSIVVTRRVLCALNSFWQELHHMAPLFLLWLLIHRVFSVVCVCEWA